jgi:hypothetical protein
MTTCRIAVSSKSDPLLLFTITLRFDSRDMIDVEKISITGNVFKMLLGSFVEEIDAMNDSVEDLISSDESSPIQETELPLQPISEEMHYSRLPPARHVYGMQQTLPVQQKAKKSRSISRFFSDQSQ